MTAPKDAEDFEVIEPVKPTVGLRADSASGEERRRFLWLGLVAIAAVAGLLAVFVWLPGSVQVPAQPVQVEPLAEPEIEPPPIDPERLAELKNTAEIALSRVVALEGELETKGVSSWAGEDWQAFVGAMNRGDDSFLVEDFEQAIDAYEQGTDLGERLLERIDPEFDSAIQLGEEALLAPDPSAAVEAFERALLVKPENSRAAAALSRAKQLPEVLTLVEQGELLEQQGRLAEASAAYQEALALDADWGLARVALNRVAGARAANRYQSAMAEGFAALNSEDFDGARRAFEKALAERANDQPALDGLAQTDQGEKLKAIALARARGSALERLEQWQGAVAQYRAALALDDTLTFAREGLSRSQERLDLDTKFEALLASPNRLFDPRTRTDAKGLVSQSQTFIADSKKLPDQTQRLRTLIQLAEQPLEVTLLSDLQTQVTLYRVGPLGQFEQKIVELTPGDYVVVGSRDGFRDVRAEIRVRPGDPPQPVTVICVERIST